MTSLLLKMQSYIITTTKKGDVEMSLILKIMFLPIYLAVLLVSVIAGFVKQTFSYVCGFFFLMMLVCTVITILNHAWSQTLLLIVLMLIGYALLFGVVATKVLIDEIKIFCFGKMF